MIHRFPIRTDRRFEAGMLALAIVMGFGAVLLGRTAGAAWAIPLCLLPLLLIVWMTVRALLPNLAALIVDEQGLELLSGATVSKREAWREPWSSILQTALVANLLGDTLVVQTGGGKREVVLSLPVLGWKLERREELFRVLAERGLAPVVSPEPDPQEGQSFGYGGESEAIQSRTVLCWMIVFFVVLSAMELHRHQWDRLVINALAILLFGSSVLIATRSVERLQVSESAITLFRARPTGFLSAFRLRPRMKEEVAWTVVWTQLRRVRLGSFADRGPALWLELETSFTKVRLLYQGEKSGLQNGEVLRAIFAKHGLPVELVIWPNLLEAEPDEENAARTSHATQSRPHL